MIVTGSSGAPLGKHATLRYDVLTIVSFEELMTLGAYRSPKDARDYRRGAAKPGRAVGGTAAQRGNIFATCSSSGQLS